ncbi:josephin-1-like [Oratosquilla oratoria]|uniref:josephin-1-like n=1 Tax=Oratosquilla oratoria TaxID=337810 RepID=UPI003F76EFC7
MKGCLGTFGCGNLFSYGHGNRVGMAMNNDIYHEKQVKELCALHSLNNLFQDGRAFTKSELDTICYSLSPDNWFNPHKSVFGTGNYDINVIMAALASKSCGIVWFDKRKDPEVIVLEKTVGFILNVPSEYRLGPLQLPLRRKHWIAIRNIRGVYYNLDSKLEAPEIIGRGAELLKYLGDELRCKEKELFIVVTPEVEHSRSWSKESWLGDPNDRMKDHDSYIQNGVVGEHHNVSRDDESLGYNSPGFTYIDQEPLGGLEAQARVGKENT